MKISKSLFTDDCFISNAPYPYIIQKFGLKARTDVVVVHKYNFKYEYIAKPSNFFYISHRTKCIVRKIKKLVSKYLNLYWTLTRIYLLKSNLQTHIWAQMNNLFKVLHFPASARRIMWKMEFPFVFCMSLIIILILFGNFIVFGGSRRSKS